MVQDHRGNPQLRSSRNEAAPGGSAPASGTHRFFKHPVTDHMGLSRRPYVEVRALVLQSSAAFRSLIEYKGFGSILLSRKVLAIGVVVYGSPSVGAE